jgi:hypothetical protein
VHCRGLQSSAGLTINDMTALKKLSKNPKNPPAVVPPPANTLPTKKADNNIAQMNDFIFFNLLLLVYLFF